MASPEFIESAVLFKLTKKENFNKFKFSVQDFHLYAKQYKFIAQYVDRCGSPPSVEVLHNEFPELDESSKTQKFEFALEQFEEASIGRQTIRAFRDVDSIINENPKQALSNILTSLANIRVGMDRNLDLYNSGSLDRLEEYRDRVDKRNKNASGLMGIPTSFTSLNDVGVGWMPGELISVFARPTIGKTWMCIHSAATAIREGFKTLLISTEMPTQSMNMRLDVVLANMMGYNLSHSALRRGDKINEAEYIDFLSKADQKSLLVCDGISGHISITLEDISNLIRQNKPEFVVIDGVYLLNTGTSKKQAWEQSHELFYGLKNLAISMEIPIMVTTQATREVVDEFTHPKTNQVAFGDALFRAADVVISMCTLSEIEDDKRSISFQKYRDGELMKDLTVMHWDVDNGNIEERPDYLNI
jgi:replicative DNA helicase